MIAGLITLFAFVSFISITIWAWSKHNRARFDEAARLPLDDDRPLQLARARAASTGKKLP